MKKLSLLSLMIMSFCFFFIGSAPAQAPIAGKWKTIDDETNEPKSIVQIFEKTDNITAKSLNCSSNRMRIPTPPVINARMMTPGKTSPPWGWKSSRT